jgi:two-component system NtrC family response regulator
MPAAGPARAPSSRCACRRGRSITEEALSLEKILIVDDEQSILNQMRWGLASEYEVITADNVEDARRLVREHQPGVVTLDVTLGPPSAGPEGLDLLDEIVERMPNTKVVMVTGNDSHETALAALKRGAVDLVRQADRDR